MSTKTVAATVRISAVDELGLSRIAEWQWIEEGKVKVELAEIPYLGDGEIPQKAKDGWDCLTGEVLS